MALADTTLKAHAQKLLGLHSKFHRQFPKDLLAETIMLTASSGQIPRCPQ
jgi:hypothetical protein